MARLPGKFGSPMERSPALYINKIYEGVDRWGLEGLQPPLPHFLSNNNNNYYTIGIANVFNIDQTVVVINLNHRVMIVALPNNAPTLRYLADFNAYFKDSGYNRVKYFRVLCVPLLP